MGLSQWMTMSFTVCSSQYEERKNIQIYSMFVLLQAEEVEEEKEKEKVKEEKEEKKMEVDEETKKQDVSCK